MTDDTGEKSSPNTSQRPYATDVQMQALAGLRAAVAAAERQNEVVSKRHALSDGEIWLQIFCSVAACENSDRQTALGWADAGLSAYRARFGPEK